VVHSTCYGMVAAEVTKIVHVAYHLRDMVACELISCSYSIFRSVWKGLHKTHAIRAMQQEQLLSMLVKFGMCTRVASILKQCSLLLPLLRGAGPMALMLWLDG
jgi:hypothetical protein